MGTGETSEGSRVMKDFPEEMTFKLTFEGRKALMGRPSGEGKGRAFGKAETSQKAGQVQRPCVREAENGRRCVKMVEAE